MLGGVDADVVDEHGLGVGGGGVGWAGPIAADGYIKDQEIRVVENPGAGDFRGGWGCGRTGQDDRGLWRERGEKSLVNIEADFGGFPFDGVE